MENPPEAPNPGIGGGFIAMTDTSGCTALKANALAITALICSDESVLSSQGFSLIKDSPAFGFCPPDKISKPVTPIASWTPGISFIYFR